jgi:DNA-binding Xre family transcriptional regulator
MRIRLAELMEARGIKTAYGLEQFADGALTISAAHRLVKSKGRPKRVDLVTLEALCDVFNVRPGELLEHEPRKPKRHRQQKAA